MHFKTLICWNFVFIIVQRMGFVHTFICREPAIMHKNDQGLTNLYGSVMLCIQHRLALFLGPSKVQVGSFNE